MIKAVLTALLLAGSSAAAPSTPASPAPAEKAATATVSPATVQGKAKVDPAQDALTIVCHTEPIVGSRFTEKRCTTKGEAAMQRLQDRQDLERAQGENHR